MKKIIFFLAATFFCIFPTLVFATESDDALDTVDEVPSVTNAQFYQAKVLDIVHQEIVEEYGSSFIRQQLRVQIKKGPQKGRDLLIDTEVPAQNPERAPTVGQYIVVGESIIAGELVYYMHDIYRLRSIVIILILFLGLVFWTIRRKGIRALLGLFISFVVILYYLIPKLLDGWSPLFVAITSAFFIATVSLYVAHGVYLRTTVAFLGTMCTIVLSIILAWFIVHISALSGLGTEEAFYLQFAGNISFDLKGLLLGGILIGTLGVLDDITTAQTAVVEQIHLTDPTLSFKELYRRGTIVGREHIISLVNTLVLAYTGAALPLLLLLSIYTQPLWVTINNEFFIEEVIRTLVGSMALIVSVPFTTAIAAYFFSNRATHILATLSWCPFFRKDSYTTTQGHTHHHHM